MDSGRTRLHRRVAAAQRRLAGIYRLEVPLRAEDFLLTPEEARAQRPEPIPRTGLLAVEERGALFLGLYFDPCDAEDPAAILEETSHWVAVAWHAAQERPVSRLQLEFQADVDRYAVARTARHRDPLGHFRQLRWLPGVPRGVRSRYRTAHAAAYRYCRRLEHCYPHRGDLPGLLCELRHFYRRQADRKLAAA